MMLDEFFTQKLEKRIQKRMAETGDYKVCAAHDLAPVLEKAFGVRPSDLAKNKSFVSLVKKGGLTLENGKKWRGIGRVR